MENISNQFVFDKERNFNELISDTFQFLKENYKLLYKALVIFAGPFLLLASFFYAKLQLSVLAEMEYGGPIKNSLLYLAFVLVAQVIIAGTVYGYIFNYLNKPEGLTLDDIWHWVSVNFLKILSTTFIVAGLIVLGIFMLIVPGIYMIVPLSLIYMVRFFEGIPTVDAIRRCFALTKGSWWKVAGTIIVINIIAGFAGTILMMPQYIFNFIAGFMSKTFVSDHAVLYVAVTTICQSLYFLVLAIPNITLVLIYYNQKNKEK